LQGATQTVNAAILRDTIATGRNWNASGLHPIHNMGVAIAQTSSFATSLRETTPCLDFFSVSIVLLCHENLRYTTE
jgi:hypothetical protein